jgi:hypothetical protein
MAQPRGKRDELDDDVPASEAPDTEASDKPRPRPVDRVDLGALSLNVPPQWQFYPLEDRNVGRHSSKVGVLQVKVLPSTAAPADASHEMFMSLARDMSGYELSGPGVDPAKERIGCCLAGGESFRSGNDFVRVWYHHRPEGVAVASFAFKAQRAAERSVKQLVRECDKIVASIRLPTRADA